MKTDGRNDTWPLMEEEVLIIRYEDKLSFNFPYHFYEKYIEPMIRKGMIKPLRVSVSEGEYSKRVEIDLELESGAELRAWLLIKVIEDDTFFISEVGP